MTHFGMPFGGSMMLSILYFLMSATKSKEMVTVLTELFLKLLQIITCLLG